MAEGEGAREGCLLTVGQKTKRKQRGKKREKREKRERGLTYFIQLDLIPQSALTGPSPMDLGSIPALT